MMKITTKSQIEKRQAGTKDDSEQKDEDLFVSPNNAKPHPMFTIHYFGRIFQDQY